jgi:hypothetical protein
MAETKPPIFTARPQRRNGSPKIQPVGWIEGAITGSRQVLEFEAREKCTSAAHAAAHTRNLAFPISGATPRYGGVALGRHATGGEGDQRNREQTEHEFLGRDHEGRIY